MKLLSGLLQTQCFLYQVGQGKNKGMSDDSLVCLDISYSWLQLEKMQHLTSLQTTSALKS